MEKRYDLYDADNGQLVANYPATSTRNAVAKFKRDFPKTKRNMIARPG